MSELCANMSCVIFFYKQNTAYDVRISDWSSDVCSSDLVLIILAKSSGDMWPTKSPLCQIAKATACQCRTPLFMKAGRSSASETPNRNRNSGLKKSGSDT